LCREICVTPAKPYRLHLLIAVIDAATSRPTDSHHQTGGLGWKVLSDSSRKAADIERFIFLSILDAEKYPGCTVKSSSTELFFFGRSRSYTILRLLGGFMQGLIGQYAIPF